MHTDKVWAPLGVSLDPETGLLSGTPTKTGAWTIMVVASVGPGKPAATRAYLLRVTK
jgi:hypothetical protein